MDLREKRADLSAPAQRASGITLWKDTAHTLGRVIFLSLWSGIIAWRWLLLVPAFVVNAVIIKDILRFFLERHNVSRRVDAWDLFPAMLLHRHMQLLLFGLGFMLLVGDSYRREQEQGAVMLTIVRLPSRSIYWLGKMGALGVMALGFVGMGLTISLLVGLIIAPPSSFWPTLPRESMPGMYPEGGLSVPVYAVLLVGYTAWSLWIAGCMIVLLSICIPHKLGVLIAMTLWTVTSIFSLVPSTMGYARLLNLGYLIGFFKHQGDDPIPLSNYFAITSTTLVLIAIAGSWRLQREDL